MIKTSEIYHLDNGELSSRIDKIKECEYCKRFFMDFEYCKHIKICGLFRSLVVETTMKENRFIVSLGGTKLASIELYENMYYKIENDKTMTPICGIVDTQEAEYAG